MKIVWESLRMLVWMVILTGLLYPILITAIAYLFFPEQSTGNILVIDGQKRGATLIAQKFTSDRYFWPRPSAVDYNPLPSGGSNLGPTSALLKKIVDERREDFAKKNGVDPDKVPSEMLFASGSGLDPHISFEAAYFQIDRVAKARSMSREAIKAAVDSVTESANFRILGTRRINVLMLNHALDQMKKTDGTHG